MLGQKRRNITVCLVISPRFDLVHHTITVGGMTRESFAEFLENTSENVHENESHHLIFNDGAPTHRRQEAPREKNALKHIATLLFFFQIL